MSVAVCALGCGGTWSGAGQQPLRGVAPRGAICFTRWSLGSSFRPRSVAGGCSRTGPADARNAWEARRATAARQQHSSGQAMEDSGTAGVLGARAGWAGNWRNSSLSSFLRRRGLDALIGAVTPRSIAPMPGCCRRRSLDNEPTVGASSGTGPPGRTGSCRFRRPQIAHEVKRGAFLKCAGHTVRLRHCIARTGQRSLRERAYGFEQRWLGERGTRFCRKRWPPTMRAVVRGLIGTALFRWFVGFSSTPKPCTVAFAILRNVPELARWTSRPLLEFGRGTFCSHVSGFPASHTAIA